MMKRTFDFVLALLALIFLSLPLCLVAIIIRLTSLGPMLFRQPRLGLGGKPFTLMKFRTMTAARGADGKPVTDHASLTSQTDNERLTSFGRFLRRTSVDELPELINVLKGDMSLVGPRPLLLRYWERYSPEQRRRNEVRPGLTGWAQVNGRNALSWNQRFALDVWYVDHRSFWLDLKIIAMTVGTILQQNGVNQSNHTTMEEFHG
jgi:sugar transferase EpsL